MATTDRVDPYLSCNFHVEIDGVFKGSFMECSGFSTTIDPVEYREGGMNQTTYKIPGQTKHANLVFKKGLTDSLFLYQWFLDATNGKIKRVTGSVVVLDSQGNQKSSWNFKNAWPTKYTGPDLNAKANEISIEIFEVAHEGLVRTK
jgi:phage tail-like protein